MEIDEKTVEHIAELARLELSPSEKKMYAAQLGGILGWMEELEKADTSAVTPTTSVLGIENVVAADKPETFAAREEILKLAPEREFDFIKVRKVIE